jgi:hypothetical protein
MKKTIMVATFCVLLLASCSKTAKNQEAACADSTEVVVSDTVATESVATEIDSAAGEVDKLVNEL